MGDRVGVLVGLACFTTAVAIIVSTADFFKAFFKGSQKAYIYTALICCVTGIFMGSYNVDFIIYLAIPALMFIYPISVVLILLHTLPERLGSPRVFIAVVVTAFVFSIPDVIGFFFQSDALSRVVVAIPLAEYNLGWVLPSILEA